MPGPVRLRRLAAAALLFALTGCGSGQGTPAAPSAFSSALPTRTIAGAVVPVLPLDGYRLTADQQERLQQAADRLATECMRTKGLDWPARPLQAGQDHDGNERRYGVSDARTVAAIGYRLPPPSGVTGDQLAEYKKRLDARKAAMSDTAIAAYTGEKAGATTPQEAGRGGCRGEATQRLGLPDDLADNADPVEEAMQTGWQRTVADPRAKAADAAWSSCMRTAGFDYPDPHKAAGDPAWRPGAEGVPASPDARELAVAKKDLDCKRETGYLTVWQTVEIEQQQALIKEREPSLRQTLERWRQALAKAEQLLNS
ncbi:MULTISPECIES: hypothetical protein [unclassified Kitasatospora]|uniref:hypothetical protein n=1 Tax=unclassified Kitasatospora TaxID=2633591 RepID=UPI00070D95AC|nr:MULTISPECIES: hypothetical protein [unclassified Kitasatospora]KRB67360.1 hypothetical protein ASE03_03150 [Kitasatospora sp. Root187]